MNQTFVKSTRFKQVCQLLLSLIVVGSRTFPYHPHDLRRAWIKKILRLDRRAITRDFDPLHSSVPFCPLAPLSRQLSTELFRFELQSHIFQWKSIENLMWVLASKTSHFLSLSDNFIVSFSRLLKPRSWMLHWQTFFRVIRLRSVVTVCKTTPFKLSMHSCAVKKRWKKTFACIYKLKGTGKRATSENEQLVLQHSAAKLPEKRCCAFFDPRIKPVVEHLGCCRLRKVFGESWD